MMRLTFNSGNRDRILKKAYDILNKGGVIVYPTDTIYGLGCDIFCIKAVERISRIKARKADHPMSIICADIAEVSNYAVISDFSYSVLNHFLPGPYTFILESRSVLPIGIKSRECTVGIRIPESDIALSIVQNFGRPILTTSVNRSGEPALNEPVRIEKFFGDDIDLLIDDGVIDSSPSTVVDLTGTTPVVLREGKGEFRYLKCCTQRA